MPVITMSGNTASGAREVGQTVARELGIDFVDQQLMVQASKRCGVPVGTVAEHDERRGSLRERLSGLIRVALERSAASGADPLTGWTGLEAILSRSYADMAAEEPQLSDSLYFETMRVLIRELAALGEVVILGRGGQMILADMPRTLNVLCVAPRELRAHRLAERNEIGMEEALHRIVDSDRAQCAFFKKFWHVALEDPKLYDVTVDTGRLSYEAAAQVIVAAARAKMAESQPA
jgi:cytidylate kinase